MVDLPRDLIPKIFGRSIKQTSNHPGLNFLIWWTRSGLIIEKNSKHLQGKVLRTMMGGVTTAFIDALLVATGNHLCDPEIKMEG